MAGQDNHRAHDRGRMRDTRKNTYKELLAYIHEQGVYVPLSYSRTKAVHVPALKGVTFCTSQYEIPL